jgi:hypothetical protein
MVPIRSAGVTASSRNEPDRDAGSCYRGQHPLRSHRIAAGRAGKRSPAAGRPGLRAAYALAPGAAVVVRSSYVAGSDFSGGGSAPSGIELGLSAGYGPGSGRFRVTGDYEFQRIDRRTDQNATRLSVPIQSSVARLGLAVRF